jgi:hypothetical protein
MFFQGFDPVAALVHSAGPPISAKRHEQLLWFSLPILEYHDQHRRGSEAKMGAKGRAILHEHLRQVLAELIADEVRRGRRKRRDAPGQIPSELLVQYVASTFILVLNWWLESGGPLSPQEVNGVFRALVLPTLAVE